MRGRENLSLSYVFFIALCYVVLTLEHYCFYVNSRKALGLEFALSRQGKLGFGGNPKEAKEELVLMVFVTYTY